MVLKVVEDRRQSLKLELNSMKLEILKLLQVKKGTDN